LQWIGANLRESRCQHQKENFSIIFLARISMLGELEPFFLIHIAQLYEMYVNLMHIFCPFCNFRVYGKFLETARRAIRSRQASHSNLSVF